MTEPVPWTNLFERVKSEIPAVPDVLLRHQINATAIDFTTDTNTFVEEVPVNVVPNTAQYPLTFIDGGKACRLLLVYDPNLVKDGSYTWADASITMRIPGILRLARVPTQPQAWVAVVAKSCGTPQVTTDIPPKPTGYLEIDSWIVDRYYDTMYYGVMWLLQRMPAKPFRDPKAAAENYAQYTSGKSTAKANDQWKNIYNGQAWMYPQAFRTITRKGWT